VAIFVTLGNHVCRGCCLAGRLGYGLRSMTTAGLLCGCCVQAAGVMQLAASLQPGGYSSSGWLASSLRLASGYLRRISWLANIPHGCS